MAYDGQALVIPLGGIGLMTDDVHGRLPAGALIEATNVSFTDGTVEKCPGAWLWNRSAEASSIIALADFWPDDVRQRVVIVLANGQVRRYADREAVALVTAISPAPTTLTLASDKPPTIVVAGAEAAGRNRKAFVFTGRSPVQVISGDATERTNLSAPAADWMDAYPDGGVLHANRLVAWGGRDPHRIYLSDPDDHEDFTSLDAKQFSVFPGEAEGILSACVYMGRLFIFKDPYGAYYLDDSDPDVANWAIRKLGSGFGAASAHSAYTALGDLFVANSSGGVTSLTQSQKLGGVEFAEVFRNLRCENAIRGSIAKDGARRRFAVYYEDKRQVLLTYQSSSDVRNDLLLSIDYQAPDLPQVSVWDAFQPTCLAMVKDPQGTPRPMIGSDDGYLRRLDWATREVEPGGAIASSFQTPHVDGGVSDPTLSEQVKNFSALELTFEQSGNWDVLVDVFIDHTFSETISFRQNKDTYLGNFPLGSPDAANPVYTLAGADVIDRAQQSYRRPLRGSGRRISFRLRQSGLRETFRVTSLTVYFKVAGQRQKG